MISEKKNFKIRKELFISSSKTKNIKEDYDYIRELGAGGYGVVFLAQHKITNERRAIKTISKDDVKDKEIFATEVQLLKKLDHPNIIKLYQVYETEKTIYLVTEVCEGGELFYLIVQKKHLNEAQTAVIMRQIFSAIAYLHEQNICHRDLKPENILLKEKENIRSIKLIDFGIAKVFKEKEFENQPKGTTMYLAPEMIGGRYGKEVDNWYQRQIIQGLRSHSLHSALWSSPLLRKGHPIYLAEHPERNLHFGPRALLQVQQRGQRPDFEAAGEGPHEEIHCSEVLRAPLDQKGDHKGDVGRELLRGSVQGAEQAGFDERVSVGQCSLKRTLLMYLAVQIPEKEIENVRKIFLKLDENGNGMISKEEMKVGLDYLRKQVNLKLNQDDIDQIFAAMDFDNSGYIDYSEFIASFLDCSSYMNDTFLRKEFTKLDNDKDGKLNRQDIEKIVRLDTVSLGSVDVQGMIDEADLDGDGKIDYQEFLVLLRERTRTFFKV